MSQPVRRSAQILLSSPFETTAFAGAFRPRPRHCAFRHRTAPPAFRTFAVKAGTPLRGLDLIRGADPPVAMERSEYPPWIDDLAKPMISLAQLRRMAEEEATDREKMRYLKLTRRRKIKESNLDAADV